MVELKVKFPSMTMGSPGVEIFDYISIGSTSISLPHLPKIATKFIP